MNRQVADDTSTSDVVWAAAERIGKKSNADDINRICEYLISKHWFQNAGDLRAARQNAQEWQALEVPCRLKIAMQEVLDSPAKTSISSPGKLQRAATAEGQPLECESSPSHGAKPTAEHAAMSADLYAESVSTSTYPSGAYVHDASNTVTESYTEVYSQTHAIGTAEGYAAASDEDEAAAAAAHAAAWEAYYATNGYYQYYDQNGAAVQSWDYSTQEIPADEGSSEAVAEAEEVVVEEAVAAEELVEDANEWSSAVGIEPVVPVPTWQCGQCTYANTFAVAFCEMCCGHISLSADAPCETDVPIESAVPEKAVVAGESASPLGHLPPPPPYTDVYEATQMSRPPPSLVSIAPPSPTRPPPLEPPLYVTIPCPTESTSQLYSPSAPDFDCITLEDEPTALQAVASTTREVPVKQLPVFTEFPVGTAKDTEISAPLPTSQPSPAPSPPKVDYRALAFKRSPSMPSSTASTGLSPQKSPARTATEFSF